MKQPVTIWPHLIPFIFNEMEGDMSASTPSKKVKLIKLSKSSNLGLFLMILLERSNPDIDTSRITGHSIFLSIEKRKGLQAHKATLFSKCRNNNQVIELDPDDCHIFNNYLEYLLRMCLISYINGYTDSPLTDNIVREAIRRFMVRHELFEYDIDPEALRVAYYNNVKKSALLAYQQARSMNKR